MAKPQGRGDRHGEYARRYAREQEEARRLGFANRSQYKSFLARNKRDSNPFKRIPTNQRDKTTGKRIPREEAVRAWQAAYDPSKPTSFEHLGKGQRLNMAQKHYFVDILQEYTNDEWDELYGTPQ